jgi:hypothetical protein
MKISPLLRRVSGKLFRLAYPTSLSVYSGEKRKVDMPDVVEDIVAFPPKIDKTKARKSDVVLSRSRRSKLGGALTTVTLKPDGKFEVECKHGRILEAASFAAAMRLARYEIAKHCPHCSRVANGEHS